MGLRSLRRQQLRQQYERFCLAWGNERRYQRYILENGMRLDEGHRELGRKPTFAMWLQAVRNRRLDPATGGEIRAEAEERDPRKVEVGDTSWEEE